MALLLTNRSSRLHVLRVTTVRIVGLPAYFLLCAAGLGSVSAVAASSGAAGLSLFAGAHMGLALVAVGWRVQVTETGASSRSPEYGPMPIPGARLSSEAGGRT